MERVLFKRLWLTAIVCVFAISGFAGDDDDKANAEKQSTESTGSVSDEIVSSGVTDYNGHGVVDLGLSVKWATMNVGANSPEDVGDKYAWGEVYTKKIYGWHTSVTRGTNMQNIAGDKKYDAAAAKWGGSWRMPTRTEMLELVNRCEWTLTTQNDVKGFVIKGPNGNSIFLPGTYRSRLYYWTSTPCAGYSNDAISLFHDGVWTGCTDKDRMQGFPIRPVSQ